MAFQTNRNGRSAGRAHRGQYRPMSDINVTPFVDVMLVLLIVFMITAPLLTVGVPVDLPKTRAASLSERPRLPPPTQTAIGRSASTDRAAALNFLETRSSRLRCCHGTDLRTCHLTCAETNRTPCSDASWRLAEASAGARLVRSCACGGGGSELGECTVSDSTIVAQRPS